MKSLNRAARKHGLLRRKAKPPKIVKRRVIDERYIHISNGGVRFRVVDSHGPTLEIESGSFGHILGSFVLHTTRANLYELGVMLVRASHQRHGFSKDYINAAELILPRSKLARSD